MLTERGWAAAGAGFALIVLWTLFGEVELGIAGLLLVVGVATALGFTALNRPNISVARRITPMLVHDGDHATVTLILRTGQRSLRHLSVIDEVAGLGTADFSVGSVGRASSLSATYRILCRPRGVYPIGPTRVSVSDPLGLATLSSTTGPIDPLVVYPAIEELSGFPAIRGRNLTVDAHRPEHNQRGGEDFYTLREYQKGDDLRRVHWPSSAHRDQLMIRQLETPWQARAMVVLDIRAEVYEDEACFEHAVSGAASVVRHLARSGFAADVWTGWAVTDASLYAPTMEALATVQQVPGFDLHGLAARLRRSEGGGALVLVGGNPDQTLLGIQRMLALTYPTTILLTTSNTTSSSMVSFQRAGVVPVSVTPDEPWAPEWAHAMRTSWHTASAG